MIQPIIAGVAFTHAIDIDGQDIVLLEAVNGLGEKLVSGHVTPTQIKIPIHNGKLLANDIVVSGVLIDGIDKINKLIPYIETLIQRSKNDLDLEWCIDDNDKVWFVQARPITTPVFVQNKSKNSAIPIVSGTVTAPVFVISEQGAIDGDDVLEQQFKNFPDGAILIAKYTESTFVPIMKRASGIITEQGGILSHAAILARELSKPCIVNYPNATTKFKTGDIITMNASTGQVNNDDIVSAIDENAWKDEAWYFDDMIKVPYKCKNGRIFLEPLSNKLNVYAAWVQPNDPELEIFIRKKFGAPANRIYDGLKFNAWYEDYYHRKLPEYTKSLEYAKRVAASGSATQVHKFYKNCMNKAAKYIPLAQNAKNAAARLYYNEIIMGQYIILDVIFPRAIALRQIYFDTAYTLYSANATFADLLAGRKIKGITKKYYNFITAISQERDKAYPNFKEMYPVIEGYWQPENYEKMYHAALDVIGIAKNKRNWLFGDFFDNIHKIKQVL